MYVEPEHDEYKLLRSRVRSNSTEGKVHKYLSSSLLYKSVEIRMYKYIILSVVLYECEIRPLTLRHEHTLRVFEKRVLRRIFGPKRNEVMGGWSNCIMRSFMTCTLH
jgi:hypothetical protein